MRKHQFKLPYHRSIVEAIGAFSTFLLYLSGLGRFRVVLIYATYSTIKSLLLAIRNRPLKDYLLIPAVLLALIFDFNLGPIKPIYGFNNIFISVVLMIVIDVVARKYAEKKINKLQTGVFLICPICRFCHENLVSECTICKFSHEKNPGSPSLKNEKIASIVESLETRDSVGDESSHKLFFQMRLPKNVAFFKNGIRCIRNNLVMTDELIGFVHLCKDGGWRDADVIFYEDIKSVDGKMKILFMANRPFLTIANSENETFEVAFSSFSNYKEIIKKIIDKIRLHNKQVVVNYGIKSMSWKAF